MDLYVLDSNFLKHDVVDQFISLIWTERYNDSGDINLVMPSNNTYKALLKEGTFVRIDGSKEVMLIDTVDDKDGTTTYTGRTLVDFLKQRILRPTWAETTSSWALSGFAGVLAGQMVTAMCIAGGTMDGATILPNGSREIIPKLKLGPITNGDSISVPVPYGTLFDGVKMVCDLDNMGFTMYPTNFVGSNYDLIFTTYLGKDRTSDQGTNPIVLFEPALDNLVEVEELRSISGYKTNAFAWPDGLTAQNQIGYAFVNGLDTAVGFSRRTLMVDASDINVSDYASTPLLVAALNQKALDALINNNYVRMTNGQIVPQVGFVYGTDYFLGDVIELRGVSDTPQSARVTEYIQSQDATGYKAYPTLSVIS